RTRARAAALRLAGHGSARRSARIGARVVAFSRSCSADDGRRSRCAGPLYSAGFAYGSANDVDRREEADPDDVDEVPVDRRRLDRQMALRAELALERAEHADRVE